MVGCATGGLEMAMTVAGGQTIRVPMGRNGAELTNEAGVQIRTANFTPNPEKKIVGAFGFTDSRHRVLRSVLVQDVSDNAAATFVDDAQPTSAPDGTWNGQSPPLEFHDSRLSWIGTLSNSMRAFRFTLTFSDGQTLVLHQGTFYSAAIKSTIRHSYGENY